MGVAYLITPIADGPMTNTAASAEELSGGRVKTRAFGSRLEAMTRMMAMLHRDMTWNAEIIVIT